MAVNLSPVGGVAGQFFDNNGDPLSGGKLFSYVAGTTTPQTTYTSSSGTVPHANPIILDAAGRVSGSSEIWLVDNVLYKFILKTSDDVLLATWDNVPPVGNPTFSTYVPASTSLLAPNPLTVKAALDTITNENDGASYIGYLPPYTAAVATTVQNKLAQTVSVLDFGAVGDGVTDDTAAIQAAFNAVSAVEFPAGNTFITSGNTIPSNRTLIVNGTIKLKGGSPAGTKMLANSDQIGGNTNIKIIGPGVLDGNKANQSGATNVVWHTLVDIDNCSYFEFAVASITGNYFPVAVTSVNTTGAVYVRNSNYAQIHDSIATDYGREAFWCESCDDSRMFNLSGIGGTDSWSAVQFSGARNQVDNIYAYNAGASGASFDITNSTITNVINYANRFQNGINFGHAGIPANGTVAKNITSINAAIGSTNSGIQIAASTTSFVLDGFRVENAAGNGLRASDGADNIRICNGSVTGSTLFGLVLFSTETTNYPRFVVCNVDLRGNTSGPYTRSTGQNQEQFEKVRLSDDVMFAAQSVASLGVGGTVTVTNGNVRETSTIVLNPSNLSAANAVPIIQTVNAGNFVIQTVNSGAAGASVRYYIV